MPWFVKLEKGKVPKAEFDRHVPAHREYVRMLNDQGRRAKTGYWAEKGGGMMLFQAASMEEACRLVLADPLVRNNCVDYEIHEWVIVAGD